VYQRGDAEVLEASMALETGTLTEAQLREGEGAARTANNLAGQKEFAVLRARWALERGDNAAALEAADAAIEIVRRTGERAVFPYSLRALALARMGRAQEAREALLQSSNNAYSAEACIELGLAEAAAQVLTKAYRAAWDDGPPHCYRWELDRCRVLLGRLQLPEPPLAPFDAARVEPLPHEENIRAALAI
jgi:tetratricopeptide (TPR) repeat protein